MATPSFPETITIGHGDHQQEMVNRPGELLLGFTVDLTPEQIDALLPPSLTLPAADVDPGLLQRAELRGYRWVVDPSGSPRDRAREVLQAVPQCWFASPVYVPRESAVPEDASVPLPGTLIVQLAPDGPPGGRIASIEALGLRWEGPEEEPGEEAGEEPGEEPARSAYFSVRDGIADDGFDLIERVREVAGVLMAGFDWLKIDPVELTPKGSLWAKQWNLSRIRMPEAWDITEGSDKVIVAVIDTGFDLGHPAISGSLSPLATHACFSAKGAASYTRTGDAQVPMKPTAQPANTTDDICWHGTAVAGIIAASLQNSEAAGIAPGCTILPIRLEDFTFVTVAEALKWARAQGAKVVNLSISVAGPDYGVETEINKAVVQGGMVICAAAGNGGPNNPNAPIVYPARYSRTIAVGAVVPANDDPKEIGTGERWYSRYGADLDVLAPGIQIPTVDARGDCGFVRSGDPGQSRSVTWYATTYLDDDAGPVGGDYLAVFTGTSAAVAQVSALAGLLSSLEQQQPPIKMSGDRVRRAIESNCVKVGKANAYGGPYANGLKAQQYGYGRIDAAAALNNP